MFVPATANVGCKLNFDILGNKFESLPVGILGLSKKIYEPKSVTPLLCHSDANVTPISASHLGTTIIDVR